MGKGIYPIAVQSRLKIFFSFDFIFSDSLRIIIIELCSTQASPIGFQSDCLIHSDSHSNIFINFNNITLIMITCCVHTDAADPMARLRVLSANIILTDTTSYFSNKLHNLSPHELRNAKGILRLDGA